MVASRYDPPDSPLPRKSKRASAKPASGIIRPSGRYLSLSLGSEPVACDHAWERRRAARKVQDTDDGDAADADREALR